MLLRILYILYTTICLQKFIKKQKAFYAPNNSVHPVHHIGNVYKNS